MADQLDIDALIEQCRAGDRATRRQAILALGKAGAANAAGAIIECLSDSDPQLRYVAVSALDEIDVDDVDAVGRAIEPLLADSDWLVRSEAAEVLGGLHYTPARSAMERRLLEDQEATVRASAAEGLGDLGDRRALPALIASLADQDGPVRSYAALAIGLLGDKTGLSALQSRLQTESDISTRRSLLVAASRLGDIGALDQLVIMADLDHSDAQDEFESAISDLLREKTPDFLADRVDELVPRLRAVGATELIVRLEALKSG